MLRLLFDQAYAMRPSIIFFDEVCRSALELPARLLFARLLWPR